MKIALHQMCSGIDAESNCAVMLDGIKSAAASGAAMYFAPEMSLLLDRNRSRAAQSIRPETDNSWLARIGAAAANAGIWVHIGSLPVQHETANGHYANRSILFDASGSIRARYDKIHLFDVDLTTGESWRESSVYRSGDSPCVVETPIGLMGLSICYDLRFPDLYSSMAKAGALLMTVPAAFTVPTGKAHWHILLRARAIEAAAFVIAPAQCGRHADGRDTYGHSLVVDPWGEVLLDMGQGEGLGFADINLSRVAAVRDQIPVHLNRRTIVPL